MRDSHLISRKARDCVRANRKYSGLKSAREPIARKRDALPPLRPIADMTSSPRMCASEPERVGPHMSSRENEDAVRLGGLYVAPKRCSTLRVILSTKLLFAFSP